MNGFLDEHRIEIAALHLVDRVFVGVKGDARVLLALILDDVGNGGAVVGPNANEQTDARVFGDCLVTFPLAVSRLPPSSMRSFCVNLSFKAEVNPSMRSIAFCCASVPTNCTYSAPSGFKFTAAVPRTLPALMLFVPT